MPLGRGGGERGRRISGEVAKLYEQMRAVNGVHTKYTLAELLDVTPETVMQYVRDGRLKVYRPGRNPLFLLEDVITFIIANPEQDLKNRHLSRH